MHYQWITKPRSENNKCDRKIEQIVRLPEQTGPRPAATHRRLLPVSECIRIGFRFCFRFFPSFSLVVPLPPAMAARLFQQTAAPAVATLLLGSTVLYPRVAHAETPDFARKPIYDEYEEVPTSATIPKTVTPSADSPSTDLIPSSSDDSTDRKSVV